MTILYKPVRIESAEQAASLPVGTVARMADHEPEVCVKDGENAWLGTHSPGAYHDAAMVGETALAPVEAEEEDTREFYGFNGTWHIAPPSDSYQSPRTRYVTPWEEA